MRISFFSSIIIKLKEKNNKFVSNFFFKSEKKHVRIRDKSLKKIIKKNVS